MLATVQQEILEGAKFDKFSVWVSICQMKIHHFEPLCVCSMAHGHKFIKICQIAKL